MIEELEKILKKDPIIYTKHAKEIISNPEEAYNYYQIHAATHMPIGKTDDYYQQIEKCVIKNKTTHVGGVVGDYGLGKTSILIYYWFKAQKNELLAIPPYSWDTIQDHFDVAYHWSRYILKELCSTTERSINDLDSLYKKYQKKSIESEAKLLAKEQNIDISKAENIIRKQVESGRFILDYSEENLLDFYDALSEIGKKANLQGLIIFTDEPQQTVDSGKMSFKEMAGILFNLANGLGGRSGNYGMFFGMPLTFQARLGRERGDVLARLRAQKCFIDLGEWYGIDFSEKLWNKYVETYNLQNISGKIAEPETLISIGQICDSRRRDLGNGPRSVISTFNMMIAHYKEYNSSYRPSDFVKHCLEGEIILGDKSTFVGRINDLIIKPFVKEYNFEDAIMLLCAFPNGVTREIEDKFNLKDRIEEFVKESGGLGKIVITSPGGGNQLKILRYKKIEEEESALKEMLSHFYNAFSVDQEHICQVFSVFTSDLITKIFPLKPQADSITGWQSEFNKWKEDDNKFFIILNGTFEESMDYPDRRVKIEVGLPGEHYDKFPKLTDEDIDYSRHRGKDPIDFLFQFEINWDGSNISDPGKIQVKEWPTRVVKYYINPFYYLEHKFLPQIHDAIPKDHCSPFLYMCLLDYIEEQDLGSEEKQIWIAIKSDIETIIINSIFNENILEIHGADIELDNKGIYVVSDLFRRMCRDVYPEYVTIIRSRNWDKKIGEYIKLLNNNEISLSMKRGREPLKFFEENGSYDPKNSMNQIAALFGLRGRANFEGWLSDLEPFVKFDDESWKQGELLLKLHPIEEKIVYYIDKSSKRKEYLGKECQYITGRDILNDVMNSGYRYNEAQIIMDEIGPARKLFSIDKNKGYLYKLPQSIEEFKENLSVIVSDLKKDRELLKTEVREYEPTYMIQIFSEAEKIKDEEQYENVLQKLKIERTRINNFITNQLTRIIGETKNSVEILKNEFNQHEGKISKYTKSKPDSTVAWIHSLAEIQKKLEGKNRDIRYEFTNIERKNLKLSNRIDEYVSKKGDKNVKDFIQIYNELNKQINELNKNIKPRIEVFLIEINHLEKWFDIARLYQTAFEKTIAVEQNLGNQKPKEEFEKAVKNLQKFLEEKKEEGLKSCEIKEKEIREIIDKTEKFIRDYRTSFNEQKSFIFDQLKIASYQPPQIRTTFSEEDVKGSNDALGNECYDIFTLSLNEIINLFSELNIDLEYSKKILDLNEEIKEHDMVLRVKEAQEKLNKIKKQLTPEIFTNISDREKLSQIAKEISEERIQHQKLQGKLREIQSPSEVGKNAKQLLEQVVTGQTKNLKDIILEITKIEDIDLDKALDILKECFKSRRIDIIVKRKL